ncbi:hypothetical protein AAY473_019687, partial [Plecturocebus cupreus]
MLLVTRQGIRVSGTTKWEKFRCDICISLNISGLLENRNIVLWNTLLLHVCPQEIAENLQRKKLVNAVNVVVPSVINYVTFYVSKIQA